MRILITGSSGFIGSFLKEDLKNLGFEIVTIGRSNNEDFSIDLKDPKLESIILDFSPDIVCHLASGSGVAMAHENKEKEFKDTVSATNSLIKSLGKLKQKPIVIYLSSQTVYGEPEYLPIKESHSTKPKTVYGENKLKAEEIIIQSKLPYVIFRISSVFGPNQDYKKSGVIAKFINRLQNKQPPIVFNSFDSFCDFIYVKDVASAIKKTIQEIGNKEITNQVFNLGSGKPTSLNEVLDILYRYFPKGPMSKLQTNPLYLSNNYKGLYLDIKRIQTRLEWTWKYTVEDGLKEMLQHEFVY